MSGEDKIREEIRRRILEKMKAKQADEAKKKTFKLSGNEAADERLNNSHIKQASGSTHVEADTEKD